MGCHNRRYPGLIPNYLPTSAGMVIIFFWVTVVIMDVMLVHGIEIVKGFRGIAGGF
jgi:hypothetical protein